MPAPPTLPSHQGCSRQPLHDVGAVLALVLGEQTFVFALGVAGASQVGYCV